MNVKCPKKLVEVTLPRDAMNAAAANARDEVLYGMNQVDKSSAAIALVGGERHEDPYYIRRPFTQESDWAVTSINLALGQLISRAEDVG